MIHAQICEAGVHDREGGTVGTLDSAKAIDLLAVVLMEERRVSKVEMAVNHIDGRAR